MVIVKRTIRYLSLAAVATSFLAIQAMDQESDIAKTVKEKIVTFGSSCYTYASNGQLVPVTQAVVHYRYPLAVGGTMFTASSIYSYLRGTLSRHWPAITGSSIATSALGIGLQMFYEKFVMPSDKELYDNAQLIIDLIRDDIKYQSFINHPTILNKCGRKSEIINMINELYVARKNKQNICQHLNKIAGFLSPKQYVVWNYQYKNAINIILLDIQDINQELAKGQKGHAKNNCSRLVNMVFIKDNTAAESLIAKYCDSPETDRPARFAELSNFF